MRTPTIPARTATAQSDKPTGSPEQPPKPTKEAKTVKVAVVHAASVFLDAQGSAYKAIEWIDRAGAEKVELLVFPEVFLPGFPLWINAYPPVMQVPVNNTYMEQAISLEGPEISAIRAAAARNKMTVIMGASERRAGPIRTIYNASIAIGIDGSILGVHRKIKPTYAERYIWGEGGGDGLATWQTPVGCVGSLVCWEHTLNNARQALIEQGEQIHAAHWPSLSTIAGFTEVADMQIEAMMRNHALTAQCFVLCAAGPVSPQMLTAMHQRLGEQNLVRSGGGWSAIIHPFGPILAGPHTGAEEKLLVADLDMGNIDQVKLWLDPLGHYARPDLFQLRINMAAPSTAEGIKPR